AAVELRETADLYRPCRFCEPPQLSGRDAAEDAARLELTRASAIPARATEFPARSEEHTSELQSLTNLVCRLLLEKKKQERDTAQLGHDGRHTLRQWRVARP